MSLFTDRIEKLMKDQGVTQDILADKVGVTQTTISRICRGEAKRSKYLPDIAKVLGVTEQWLLFGDAGESNADIMRSEINVWDNNTPIPDDMVAIPFFNGMSLSAGYGALNADIPHDGAMLWFAKSFIKRKGTMPDHVFCITVKGDSMEPRYDAGGVVVIDTLNKNVIDGKAYAITYQEQDYIKYLRRLPDNKLLITSENSLYEPFKADAEDVQIIGKVMAYQREEY